MWSSVVSARIFMHACAKQMNLQPFSFLLFSLFISVLTTNGSGTDNCDLTSGRRKREVDDNNDYTIL